MCLHLGISLSVAIRLSVRNVLGNAGLFFSLVSGNVSREGPCFLIVCLHSACDVLRTLTSKPGRNSCSWFVMRQEKIASSWQFSVYYEN